MKWYGHLLFYLISCVVAELLLVMFFALDAIGSNVIEPIREKLEPTYCPGPNKETRKRRKAVKKARRLNRRK